MANPKNLTIFLNYPSRTHITLISILFISLFFILTSIPLSHLSPSLLASSFASRLLSAANFLSPFSSSPSDTCTLSAVASAERKTHGKSTDWRNQQAGKELGSFGKLASCDMFDGKWVLGDSGRVYKPGSCPFVEDKFNCYRNGRKDLGYLGYVWKPHGCTVPRFDGKKLLRILRGKRLVFVGDSLNRNMWESLVCALRQSLKDKTRVLETSRHPNFKTNGFYSFRFKDYSCSVEFVKSPFLVQQSKFADRTGKKTETLRLDQIQESSSRLYRDANIIIFNTGHWWTHQKTFKGKGYFEEGRHVYDRLDVAEAYSKALHTWARWVDANIDVNRTRVFFVGYSSSHFRKGKWNSGGRCDSEISPIKNVTDLGTYPWMMKVLESVISEMKTPVFFMNITKMTAFRKDGHPSVYRPRQNRKGSGMIQDCSHWCLPGVPDTWNQLLYATLLVSRNSLTGHN